MPTFCRHNHLIQNCPICSREQHVEMRPVITSSAPAVSQQRPRTPSSSPSGGARSTSPARVRVSRLARGVDDGFQSPLVTGVRSSADAERLAEELAFAAGRLAQLTAAPPGLYADVADPIGDIEERSWLAFLIAYMCPLDTDDPFSSIRAVRTSWASGEQPALDGAELGPRTAHDPARGTQTLDAYRAWAGRAGSQAAALIGEQSWPPERRFDRTFERLALPGLHRDARFDLMVTLGRLGVYDIRAGSLQLGGDNQVTVAAKRALGIGDKLLLERRADALASACGVPLEALDLGLYNWERGDRATLGIDPAFEPDGDALESARTALGL